MGTRLLYKIFTSPSPSKGLGHHTELKYVQLYIWTKMNLFRANIQLYWFSHCRVSIWQAVVTVFFCSAVKVKIYWRSSIYFRYSICSIFGRNPKIWAFYLTESLFPIGPLLWKAFSKSRWQFFQLTKHRKSHTVYWYSYTFGIFQTFNDD